MLTYTTFIMKEAYIMNMKKTVCYCMNVTNGDVKEAVKSGAKTLADVQKVTKGGTGCGRCRENIQHLIDEFVAEQH